MQLERRISRVNLLLLSIGSIIGSGWLFGSLYSAQIAGPGAILSWIIGGVLIMFLALPFAELCTLLPISGGSVAYMTISHGKISGAIFAWISWLWTVIVPPIEAQAIIQYSSGYFPSLFDSATQQLSGTGFLTALAIMLVFTLINIVGVKFMAETNKFIVFWKLIIPVTVAILLLSFNPHFENLHALEGGFMPYGAKGILNAISVGGISMSFFGFQTVFFLAGETQEPRKAIPFALFGSLVFCVALYLILQLGFLVALPADSLVGGWSKLTFSGDAGPFAGLLLGLGFAFMTKVLYFDAVLSPFGTGVGYVAGSSRILYGMSLQKDAPSVLSRLNRFRIPWVTLVVNFVLGMSFFLPFSGWQAMVAFLSAAIVLSLACGPICFPLFRKHLSDKTRPYALPFGNAFSFLSFYICNLLLQWTGWNTIWKLNLVVGFGIVFVVAKNLISKQKKDHQGFNEDLCLKNFLWFPLYLACASVVSYVGDMGGGLGYVSTAWNFPLVLAYSIFIYWVALKSSLDEKRLRANYDGIVKQHNLTTSF